MQPGHMVVRRVLLGCLLTGALAFSAAAQQKVVPSRIVHPIDDSNLTILKGNTHPLANVTHDQGAAPASLPLDRMVLVLKRSPEQQAALDALIGRQQDKASPDYHHWLTPEQFGQQFGPSDDDIQAITAWLEAHGFQVNRVARGRATIEFSGSAGLLQDAFHTEIHKYLVNGEEHWANAGDPEIPAALAPVVAGIRTLYDFRRKPNLFVSPQRFEAEFTPGKYPQFSTTSGVHALAPGDYATIYNITPVYNAGIDGTGTTIAVVGRSNFYIQDVTDFRSSFLLPSNPPQVVLNGPDPGIFDPGEQFEATLDAAWSGAVAPGAQVIFVASASTNTTDGVDLSEQYIIDNDLGNVMTESFSGCEAGATSADASAISSLAEQGAAEGITYMVSTGDSGAEGCDNPNRETRATGPVSVNVLASSPYTLGVGGTLFNENGNNAKYWNSSNQANASSVLSYIPENVWNESCTSGCGQNGAGSIWAGGGGASTLFSKPSWQASVTGIPADGHRDLPDVSLTAAGHDPYLLCFQFSCESGFFYGVSGTSASAPSFAGIMALVNQKTGSRQGQAAYVLYRLAAQETYSQCNGSSTAISPGATCIFNDVTVGNNAVPGEAGYGTGSAKYQSTVGYDLATGLGSVNVANLVNGWNNARSVSSTTTLSLNPSSGITHGTPVSATITVAATPPATGTPTGDVALVQDTGPSPSNKQEVTRLTLSGGMATGNNINQLSGGTYNVQAHYEGDGTFLPSDSTAMSVTVAPEMTTETASALTGTPPNLASFSTQTYGVPIYLQAVISGSSGVGTPTGTVTFTDSVQGLLDTEMLDGTGTALSRNVSALIGSGSHSVTAAYSGDASFKSTSAALSFTLTPDASTTTIQTPQGPLILGSNPQLEVTVSANSYGRPPSGTVTAFVSGSQVGSPATLTGQGSGLAIANSIGFVSLSSLPTGQATVTVSYSGDSNYQASTSAPLTVSIVRGTTVSIASSSPTIQVGQSVTFTAAVTPTQSGGPAVTGTVQFFDNGATIDGAMTLQNGQAQIVTSSLSVGGHSIRANYSGDSNYAPSNNTFFETVTAITTTTTVATSNGSINQGQSVTFTATVTPSQTGGPALTGNVQFAVNGSFVSNATLNSGGQATLTLQTLAAGSDTISATYLGDSNYSGSSGSVSETVAAQTTFVIIDNSPSIIIGGPGQAGSTQLTFTAFSGFTGSITLTSALCSNLPSEASCSFSPSAVNLTAQTTTQNVMLTIMTTAPSAVAPTVPRMMPGNFMGLGVLALLCAMGLGAMLATARERRRWSAVLAFITIATIAAAASCGGSGGSTPPPHHDAGTPIGNYTGVTVTVTMGGVTQSINTISVNVQ